MSRARAHTNIALVKYWGKRDRTRNLPATGSLSLTLDRYFTTTSVEAWDGSSDTLTIDGEAATEAERARASGFLDRLRAMSGHHGRFRIVSHNDVPTAAGLASSASGFAALTVAAAHALELTLSPEQLSGLAREGSGSAARSLFGGFVRLRRGSADDGHDSVAHPIPVHPTLDLRLLVVRCASGRKKRGSTDAMEHTAATSPYFAPWVETHERDLDEASEALASGDLERLGEVMEFSTLKMHASALAARPGIWYFAPTTVAVLDEVRRLRETGICAYFTMDAGPHVKVLCRQTDAAALAQALADVPGVLDVEIAAPGPGAALLPAASPGPAGS